MHAKTWITATRPKTLPATVSPILLGTALAYAEGFFNPFIFLMTLLTGLGVQITANLANDYFDFLKGADTSDRKGPIRVTQAGLLSLSAMKKGIIISVLCTALLGLYLIYIGGIPFACLLSISLLSAIAYTGGPYPLAYLGLGDVFVLIFFGPVAVLGTYTLQTQSLSWDPAFVGFAIGGLSSEILFINNLRDKDEDVKADKKTLIVRFGPALGKAKYLFTFAFAAILPLFSIKTHPMSLLALLFLVPAAFCVKQVFTYKDPRELNLTLERTAQLGFIYALFFALGWIL